MIVFKRYGKTVRISNRHWKSLRARFSPDNVKQDGGTFKIYKKCLLCLDHVECERCGLGVFGRGELVGCLSFLRKLFKNKVSFYSGDVDLVRWHKGNDDEAREQLKQIQKLMDKIEAQQ